MICVDEMGDDVNRESGTTVANRRWLQPSRAGPATVANLHHLDELRCPPGSDSGEIFRPPTAL